MLANIITPITKKMQTYYKRAGSKYQIYLKQEKRRKAKSKMIIENPS